MEIPTCAGIEQVRRQVRGSTRAFGINDCSVYRLNQLGTLYEQVVPIDEQDRITIGRCKYGRDNWYH